MPPGMLRYQSRRACPFALTALCALAAAWTCGCGQNGPAAAATEAPALATQPGRPPASGDRPNIVLFLIDTLRADRVGAYGCEKPTTPNIDALAGECVLFEQAYAPDSWTLPSVPAIFTSTFACEHGLLVDHMKLNESFETLPQRLKKAGYHTASLYTNPYVGPFTGLDRGFDYAELRPKNALFADGTRVAAWLEQRPAGPFFLYIHNLEPHEPCTAPPRLVRLFGEAPRADARRIARLMLKYKPLMRVDWKARQPLGTTDNTAEQDRWLLELDELLAEHRVLYDAAVRLADERVGEVVQQLKQRGLWEDTLFILLSDHGEEFNEHGGYIHGQSLYEELVRVPLLIRFPRGEFAGRRVPDVVSLVDLLPTLAEQLGRPELADAARGRSLLPLIRGEHRVGDDELVVVACRINVKKYYRPWAETRGEVNVAMRLGRWKGIWNKDHDSVEVYDLTADPHEQNNVCTQQPELARRFVDHARSWFAACSADLRPPRLESETRATTEQVAALERLGYVGEGGGDEAGADDEDAPPGAGAPATRPVPTSQPVPTAGAPTSPSAPSTRPATQPAPGSPGGPGAQPAARSATQPAATPGDRPVAAASRPLRLTPPCPAPRD